MSKRQFKEAIPYLKRADRIQEETGNDRLCGNANNNLVRCYVEIVKKKDKTLEEIAGLCVKAMDRADKAISKYNKPLLDHTIGARGRKAEALVLLGRAKKQRQYFDKAVKIRKENHLRWLEIGQTKKAANEQKYIEEIREEMHKLFKGK